MGSLTYFCYWSYSVWIALEKVSIVLSQLLSSFLLYDAAMVNDVLYWLALVDHFYAWLLSDNVHHDVESL